MNHTLMLANNARRVAYEWHGGQSSPLYQFASSGVVINHGALLNEIAECMRQAQGEGYRNSDRTELERLRRYVERALVRDEQDRLVAPWAGEEK